MSWLTGLNTLRLFAMVLIVVYHFWRNLLPGGFIAVEIFFAISGFLLAGKLLNQQEREGKISYFAFVKDRFLKLFPPLLLAVLVCLLISFAVDSSILTGLSWRSLSALTFTTNVQEILIGGSYEDSFAPNIFEHTWFLALTMQFCLLLPLAIKLCFAGGARSKKEWRKQAKNFGFSMLFAGLISFALMLIHANILGRPNRAYFAIDTHMGAFCFGAALATFNYLCPRTPRTRKALPGFILATCLITVLLFAKNLSFENPLSFAFGLPYVALLTPIMIFCIIKLQKNQVFLQNVDRIVVEAAPQPKQKCKISSRIFNATLKSCEYLGGLTFGVYLYHYPLYYLLAGILPSSAPSWLIPLLAIVLSILMTLLSTKFIKATIKNLSYKACKKRQPKLAFAFTALAIAIIASIVRVSIIPEQSIISNSIQPETEKVELAKLDYNTVFNSALDQASEVLKQNLQVAISSQPQRLPVVNNHRSPEGAKVLLIGDSVMLGAKDAIETKLPTAYVDAQENRGIETAVGLIHKYADAGQLPETIVISLVTNERYVSAATFDAIQEAAGPNHTFILMTGYAGPLQNRDSQNSVIKNYAAAHDNVYLADWYSIAVNNWSLMYADHIHLNLDGRIVYAQLLENVLSSLPNAEEILNEN